MRNSGFLNRRQTRGTGYVTQFRFDPSDFREVIRELQKFPEESRQWVVKRGLRVWGKAVIASARRYCYAKATHTKAAMFQKVKKYRSGAIWSAIGVAEGANPRGKVTRGRYGDMLPGWRSHFYEVGWTPYVSRSESERFERAARAASYWKGVDFRQRRVRSELTPEEKLRAGKGIRWRKGLRKRTGGRQRIYALNWMRKAYTLHAGRLKPELEKALGDLVRRKSGKP